MINTSKKSSIWLSRYMNQLAKLSKDQHNLLYNTCVQYFYQGYCLKTKHHIEEFDTEFKESLSKENENLKQVGCVLSYT